MSKMYECTECRRSCAYSNIKIDCHISKKVSPPDCHQIATKRGGGGERGCKVSLNKH